MPKNKQYINSGVLLLNLEAYKKDNIEQKLIENYKKFKDDILFFDQDLFYITLSDKCIYLDYEYNYLSQAPYTDPKLKNRLRQSSKIIHYGFDYKPWNYPEEEQAEIWWQYARKTPFYEELLYRMNCNAVNNKLYESLNSIFHYNKNLILYYKYKILVNLVFGKTKERYKFKKHFFKQKVNNVRKLKK